METIKNILTATKDAASTMASNAASAILPDAKQQQLNEFVVEDAVKGNTLTTNGGVPLANDTQSVRAGERGPTLIEDFHFIEKMNHFDHERIPERVVHARGAAAHGEFVCYESLADLTKATVFSEANKKTPVFLRFSTVLGSRGAPDTAREVRGFAVRFFSDEGNWDIVGNNIPVFFIQDAIKFPDLIHAGKPEPHNEVPQAQTAHDNFWDWISLNTESAHMVMWILSDRTLPRTFATMQGFGVHSFLLVNAQGKRRFVKFHWIPLAGCHSMVWDESQKLCGADPDFQRRDLYDAIEAGLFPEWELGIQVVEEGDEQKFDFDILDATKIIPEELVPIRRVGKMTLNRNIDNYFSETEQVAFQTSNLIPGIDTSNDPLLQGRHYSYVDTQMLRLGGPNYKEIPINRPVCPVTNNQRDGQHRTTINKSKVNYFPNRFGCPALDTQRGYVHAPVMVNGPKIRAHGPKFADHFTQARLFFNSLSEWEKKHLCDAAIFEIGHCDDLGVRTRMVDFLNKIDFKLAQDVAHGIGVPAPTASQAPTHNNKSAPLSQDVTAKDTIKGRHIGFLCGNGYNTKQLDLLRAGFKAAGAVNFVIGPNKGPIKGDGPEGTNAEAHFKYDGCSSTQFDALVIVGNKAHVSAMLQVGKARFHVMEAFKHGKPIIAIDEGCDFVDALSLPGVQLANGSNIVSAEGVVTVRGLPQEDTLNFAADGKGFAKAVFDAVASHRFPYRKIDSIPV